MKTLYLFLAFLLLFACSTVNQTHLVVDNAYKWSTNTCEKIYEKIP